MLIPVPQSLYLCSVLRQSVVDLPEYSSVHQIVCTGIKYVCKNITDKITVQYIIDKSNFSMDVVPYSHAICFRDESFAARRISMPDFTNINVSPLVLYALLRIDT